ncbi:hypothetical protein [Tichowtungia aerotolerans]|uniref:Uncharacterized protein n=1 Tax=Tichowtungia aerotolerans TaxID=2697043 RepID=A0A6P1MD05_9BACT|nr:hypothetical protein [Tichowtungia aerotolerans]QHI69476.1 hypothetical protein GT409_08415 [Tichowtungia aerotolerans]
MKKTITSLLLLFSITVSAENFKIQMSEDDTFKISAPPRWNMKQLKYEENKTATFSYSPKDNSFVLKVFFQRDQIDEHSVEKMLLRLDKDITRYAGKKEITLEPFDFGTGKGYGFYGILIDEETTNKPDPEPNEFVYMTRGMLRVSADTVVSFFMLTHEKEGSINEELKQYLCDFSKL